ncbi:MAG: hypothetical protein ABIQ66_01525 [Novosphingobium sp.]
MHIERLRWLIITALPLTAGCEQDLASMNHPVSTFGEANRQTYAAQVIDPNPQYEYLTPATSGDHASQAIERYRTDKVKQPDRVTSTSTASGNGGGNGGGSGGGNGGSGSSN